MFSTRRAEGTRQGRGSTTAGTHDKSRAEARPFLPSSVEGRTTAAQRPDSDTVIPQLCASRGRRAFQDWNECESSVS